jgi:putative CocE/NonD family hydrolase
MYPEEIHVPVFMIGGWYDHNINIMVELFDSLKQYGDPAVKDEHKFLIGPWAHGGSGIASVGSEQQGELFYPAAKGWSDSLAMMFFDFNLRNQSNGWASNPPVQYFQMGEDIWETDTLWPPVGVIPVPYYLRESGGLSVQPAGIPGLDTSFVYDPRDPSPTVGGPTLRTDLDQGPYDQAPLVESRNDILIFSTDTLITPIQIRGKPTVHLNVSSDRTDTDFSARLTDVYPDGRSELFADGIFRMRFTNSWYQPDSIVPGNIYGIDIELCNTAITLLPGHRLRLDITSANYPRFDANLNNGGTMYAAGDTLSAMNTVYLHSPVYSCLYLPQSNAPVSVGKPRHVEQICFFPVPADDELNFSIGSSPDGEILYSVKTITGAEVQSGKLNGRTERWKLETRNLENGIYFLFLEIPEKPQMISGKFHLVHGN